MTGLGILLFLLQSVHLCVYQTCLFTVDPPVHCWLACPTAARRPVHACMSVCMCLCLAVYMSVCGVGAEACAGCVLADHLRQGNVQMQVQYKGETGWLE